MLINNQHELDEKALESNEKSRERSVGLFTLLTALCFCIVLTACTRNASPTAGPMPCPTDARVPALAATVDALETVVPSLLETVEAMPTCAPSPTPTPLPAPGMLCADCAESARVCGAGLTCAYCPELGYRCVDPASVNGSCTTCRLQAAEWPVLCGLATWYNDSALVATGERFEPSRLTCAVDVAFWPVLAGQSLRVTRLDTGTSIVVAVTDCGYLSRAGQFEYAMRGDVARWWPCAQGFEVVIDLSPAAADMLTARETVLVWAEVVQ